MKQIILFLLAPCIFLASCSSGTKDSKPVYATNCANSLAGAYTGSDICPSSGPSSYPATIIANTPTNITINYVYGEPVKAELNCTNNTLTIPAQTFSGNLSISGSGTYTATTITVNWNGTSSGYPMSCTSIYTR